MNLFQKLFGQKKEVKAETLESKIAKLDEQTQAELHNLVSSQTSAAENLELRKAALQRVDYDSTLLNLAAGGAAAHHELVKAARKRIAQLLDEGRVSEEKLLADMRDNDVLLTIAGMCSKESLENRLLNQITEQKQLAEICQSSHSARVRQHVVARIEDLDLLKDLARALKTKDKNAYKIVKTKLDAHREEESRQAELAGKIEAILSEVNYLTGKAVDKDYVLRFERAQRRWAELAEQVSPVQAQNYASAKAVCDDLIARAEREKAELEQQASKLSALPAHRQAALDALNAWINQLCELDQADEPSLAAHNQQLDAVKEQWQECNQLDKPKTADVKAWTQLLDLAEVMLQEYRQHGSLLACRARAKTTEDHNAQLKEAKYLRRLINHLMSIESFQAGSLIRETLSDLEGIDADYASYQENRQKQTRMLGGLIRKAQQSAEQGSLKQAIGMRHSIDEKVQALDDLPLYLSRQIESLDETIQKMVDWQSYAVVPKKEALIAAMEKLVGSDLPPEALATKIKKLQDEWRSLAQSGKDRNEDLWAKFSELADKAYEPCKIHYQALADERSGNLAKRESLVKQLQDFAANYAWENADWRNVEKIIVTAKSEIRTYAPVDRAANKVVQEAFDEIINTLEAKLNGEFEKNKSAKNLLITQASKLVEMADMQQATEAVKRLQAQWKMIGRTHYRDSDKLWTEFRKHCDAVFEKKEQIYTERRAAEDEIIAGAKNLIDKLNGLFNLPAESVLAARSERDELIQQFNAIENIPEKLLANLQKDFARAQDKFDKRVQEVLKENDTQAWQDFFRVAEQMNAFCVGASKDASEKERALAELNEFVASLAHWPEGMQTLIKQRLENIDQEAPDDSRLDAYKLLCIRAEILADKESPAEDKTRRMEYQVSLLKQGLGRGVQAKKPAVEMAREWLQSGAVSHESYLQLYKRFYKSWSELV